ncbi:scavenger receptor cysteine-rich type 1 M130-like protein [Labeo rohita]|uniref:Scavenger receptor cysteine-rich type 1 M130-like protein n=1 Tax=Labeo rohita TaxID=84645 RepID=A0A498LEJ0_LABRO|nr:scavenger receptor cysteine-rich type 1 M130-like protein [Labeo rohita]
MEGCVTLILLSSMITITTSDSSLALHDGLVRLSGERQCEGEVEVFIHQVWRRVLLDSWSLTESSVVCRQLGCGSVLNFNGSSSSSPEHSHECVTGFQCSGNETHLGNCSSPQTLNCSSTQQLSITCIEFKEIRLTEGCEGNVEVFYNGSWGNVCWNQMDRDTVSLICQELNCGRSGVLSDATSRVESAPNWLDEVTCRPYDSNLWQCPSLPWGQNDCGDDEVAKITCSNLTDLSVSINPSITTSASPPVRSTSVSPSRTPPAVSPQSSVHPVLVIVLVVVLLLLLVPLLILIQQNRVMRRALSKRRHRMTSEAVYEEIQHRHNHFTQRGSLSSEELHSGYENTDELLSEEMVKEITPGYYDDVITDGLKADHETVDTPENYDIVIIGQNFQGVTVGDQEEYDDVKNSNKDERDLLGSLISEELHSGYEDADELLSEEMVKEITPGYYDDVITDGLKPDRETVDISESYDDVMINRLISQGVTEGVQEEYDDVTSVTEDVRNLLEFKEIRLTEGCEGNVEVFYNGSWARLKSAPNWLDKVKCRRHDSNLWQCPSSPWGQNDCNNKDEVAKIICSKEENQESPRSRLTCFTSLFPHQKQCSDLPEPSTLATTTSASPPVRSTSVTCSETLSVPTVLVIVLVVVLLLLLVPLLILIQQNRVMRRALSKRRHRMMIETVYEGIPHRHNHFTQRGSLISEELHSEYENADVLLSAKEFRAHDLQQEHILPKHILVDAEEMVKEITPRYYDDVITDGLKPDRETEEMVKEITPRYYDDAITDGLKPDRETGYTDLRLVNSTDTCSGRVERKYLRDWGTVCDACWDMRAASVLCRQLNCGIAVSVVGSDWFGEGSGKIWADVFDCDGNETKLSECSISLWSRAECSHRRDVGVICSNSSLALYDGLVRLSGERQCEGEVEVIIHQVWRRVLLDSWSLTESSVVCRQLGCGSVLNFYGSSSSSPEHSHECVTGFQCSGSEAHLGNCSSPQTLNCSSTQQLSITCLEFKEIRLTEGCEGNVEVFYNGSWGNVCWNQMDRDTASLICQELNCGRSGVLYASTTREKSAPNWLDKVTCRPYDLNLWQCPSSLWGQNDCGEEEVAKITCSEEETRESPQSRLTCFTSASPHQRQCTNFPDLSVSTSPATTTSVSPTVRSTSVSPPQTPSTVSPLSLVPTVLVIVLVVVLLLLLVPLLILIQQNRVMRRALSKRRDKTTTEAVYEEIQQRPNNRQSLLTQRGSALSEEQHSGYEDADKLLSGVTPDYYNEVTTMRDTKNGLSENYDDVVIVQQFSNNIQADSSLVLHDGLVRLSGERQCKGEVEVFIHQVWRRVLLDSWSLTESSVVCRQLGCGSVLNFYSSSSSSPEHSHECVTAFQCSGSEAHLGNCSSPQTLNCSSTQQLSITCLGENNNIWADSSVVSDQ